MEKLRKMFKLTQKEMKVLKTAIFASLFILSSATIAASIEIENTGHSYHTASYKVSLLGGIRG